MYRVDEARTEYSVLSYLIVHLEMMTMLLFYCHPPCGVLAGEEDAEAPRFGQESWLLERVVPKNAVV